MQISSLYPLKSDEAIITKFFFINCLPDKDVGLFNRCYEEITTNILDKTSYKGRYQRIDCDCSARFLNVLDEIYNEVNRYRLGDAVKAGGNIEQVVLPFIQIEAHGSENNIQMVNGELVSSEIFYEKILKINIVSENNTILLSNTCYGMGHILNIKVYDKARERRLSAVTPVYAGIFPKAEIMAADIESNICAFFKMLVIDGEVVKAMNAYSQNVKMKSYYCDLMWRQLIYDVINDLYPYKKYKEGALTRLREKNPNIIEQWSIKQCREYIKPKYQEILEIAFQTIEESFLIEKLIKSMY